MTSADPILLHRPENLEPLERRMDVLIEEPRLSLAERLELAGIRRLQRGKELTFDQLREIASRVQITAVSSEMFDQGSLDSAWSRLCTMALDGELVAEPLMDHSRYGSDPDYVPPAKQRILDWAQYTFLLMEMSVGGNGSTLAGEIADKLPEPLVYEIRTQASRKWFASTATLGEHSTRRAGAIRLQPLSVWPGLQTRRSEDSKRRKPKR